MITQSFKQVTQQSLKSDIYIFEQIFAINNICKKLMEFTRLI